MVQSKESEAERTGRSRRWLRIGLISGSVVVIAGAGIALAGWILANERLSPLLSKQLSELLGRPVEIGEIERLSLTKIRVGPSQMPPTATDPDTVSLEAIEVRFNLFELITRQLHLHVDLEQANLYLAQNANGEWLDIDIERAERDPDQQPFIEIEPGDIRLEDAQITLLPYVPTAADGSESETSSDAADRTVAFQDVDGRVSFSDANVESANGEIVSIETQQLDFEVEAESLSQGILAVQGAALLPPSEQALTEVNVSPEASPGLALNLAVRAQSLQATDVMPIVRLIREDIYVDITSGLVNGNVNFELSPERAVSMNGSALVSEGTVVVPALPAPIQNIDGQVRFQGRQLAFENVTAELGDLSARAGGVLDIADGYDFSGQMDPFTLAEVSELFEVNVPIETEGDYLADVTMTGPLNDPTVAANIRTQAGATLDRVEFTQLVADVTYYDLSVRVDEFQAIPQAGGSLVGSGSYRFDQPGQLSLRAMGDRLPGDELGRAYGLPDTVAIGPVSLRAEVSGPVNQLEGLVDWRAPAGDFPARGRIALAGDTIRFQDTFVQVAGGTISGDGVLVNGDWEASLQARGIQLNQLSSNLDGDVAGIAQLSGTLGDLTLESMTGDGDILLAIAGGEVAGRASLANGQWQADLIGDSLQLSQFSDRLQGSAGGQFAFTGNLNDLSLAGIQGNGQLVVSDGLAAAAPAFPQLSAAQAPLTASLAWDGAILAIEDARTAGIEARGTLTPQLEGEGAPTIADTNIELRIQDYSLAALPIPEIVSLGGRASFQGQLTGSLNTLSLVGDAQLVDFKISDLAFATPLTGQVRIALDEGVGIDLQGGEDAIQIAYSFDQRDLDFAVAAGEALATGQTRGDILEAQASNFPLNVLALPPSGLAGYGTVGGTIEMATLTANLSRSTLVSQFTVVNPSLGYLRLSGTPEQVNGVQRQAPSRLQGEFAYADGVTTLSNTQLTTGESLYLIAGRYNQQGDPQIRGQVTVEKGQIQDVLATLQFFELTDFTRGFAPPEWIRRYGPEELEAILAAAPPGNPQANLLDQLRRVSEVLHLQDSQARSAEEAPLPPLGDLQGEFNGEILLNASLPDDLEINFELFGGDWTWGSAYKVDTVIAEGQLADGVLQLRPLRFASEDTEKPQFLNISGEIALNPQDDISRTLQLTSRNIPLQALKQPLRLPQTRRLQGFLNADATLSGDLKNPQLRGSINPTDVTINRNPIASIGADFLYRDARLNFTSSMVIDDPDDPLTLTATIPYRLPFAEVKPASNEYAAELNVRDEGLQLLNLVNRQLAIESGRGQIVLDLRGTWPEGESPLADIDLSGNAELEAITLSAQVLPDPLTNINGKIRFDNDLVIVDRLTGNFSEGNVRARGAFPLLIPFSLRTHRDARSLLARKQGQPENNPDPNQTPGASPASPATEPIDAAQMPLTLNLDNIALNFKGIYNGQVDGEFNLEGSLLTGPELGGSVILSHGRLSLPERQTTDAEVVSDVTTSGGGGVDVRFEDLNLLLDDDVRIQLGGIVDVQARGDLIINGLFPNIRPVGRLRLPSGRINLVTTAFRLQGDENYAEFRPNLGLDPYLNADLLAVVPDSTGGTGADLVQSSVFPRNEISDAEVDRLGLNQSGIETVRIRAEVEGPASQVVQLRGVTLRSTPSRSEGEIVSLIAGGPLAALGSTLGSVGGTGDDFEGLIAFAGSALLNQVQDILGNALRLSEFRLYSATPESAQSEDSTIDIGAEVGFELSPTLSLSIQNTFTAITPLQFNLRYRIDDRFTLRGVTSFEDFTDNSGLLLEYETRF